MSFHNHTAEHSTQPSDRKDFLTSPAGLVMVGFLAIAGVYLWMEHRAHLLGVVVWLPLLACPLMHLFMHHGHGGHAEHSQNPRHGERQ
jgi:hypothetical protein